MEPQKPKRSNCAKKTTDDSPAADPAAQLSEGVGEFAQLALWMAASLAGLVTALLVSRGPFFRSMLKRLGAGGPDADWRRAAGGSQAQHRAPRPESLPRLADAVVGSSKSAVAAVFGPPRSAALRGVIASSPKKPAYWQANTWYYALPEPEPLAMAIEFDDDSARRVEFFQAPGL